MTNESIDQELFGNLADGREVHRYLVTNANGLRVRLCSYGAMWTECHVPDRSGQLADVLLGCDDLASYLQGHPYFGTTTGRVANRIAQGRFSLDGQSYSLAVNNPPNHLHGGIQGFDKKLWRGTPFSGNGFAGVAFQYLSPDGEEGYPGNLSLTVTYKLTDANELVIEYQAETDRATPVNLTNHAYFNLADGGASPILNHSIEINADRYTPVDETSIPTGEIASVEGTCMDLRRPVVIGSKIDELTGDPGGYDHNYVLRKTSDGALEFAARVTEPTSGRVLEISTTEPGLQFYTGNYLDGTLTGKGGACFRKRHGLCLEAQHYPDSPNHPNFPSIILNPGQTYRQTTVHKFSVQE